MGRFSNGVGSGAGHGGKGGPGMFNGTISEGGSSYGNACLPCELGSGSEGPNESYGHVAGGGMIGKHISYYLLERLRMIFLHLLVSTRTYSSYYILRCLCCMFSNTK